MNKIKTLLCATLLALTSISAMAKDYQAVAFGVQSDGVTNNTRSIQHAIDYISAQGGRRALIHAQGQHDIAITGKGIIDGNSRALSADIAEQTARGYADANAEVPALIALDRCKGVQTSGVTLQNYACPPLQFDHCHNVQVTAVTLGLSDAAMPLYEAKECGKMTVKDCLTQPRY